MLAAIFHYDMDIPTVIRFLGNNYTGEYRNSDKIIATLKETKCDEEIIKDLQRLYNIGAPNKLNTSSSHQNFLDFFQIWQPHIYSQKYRQNITSNEQRG